MSAIEFQYRAMDKSGQKRTGVTRAPSRNDAYRQVAAMGLVPVEILPTVAEGKRQSRRGIKKSEIAHFAFQLSVLISARIPIGEGLRSIAEQEARPAFKEILSEIAARIEAGEPMSSAMRAHTGVFGDIFIESIRAAEQSGNLVKVLEYLAETLEKAEEARQQVKSALMYPAVVISVLTLAVLFLVGIVIPKFAKMYATRGIELPVLTRILMAVGTSLSSYWYLYLAGFVALVIGGRMALKREGGRVAFDRFLHSIPFVSKILVGAAVARFARVFALCLSSGLNLLDALDMAGRASGRPMLEKDVKALTTSVRTGGRLGAGMATCSYFPSFARRMIAAGEESAELPRMCGVIARQYDRDTAVLIKNFATIIEPVLVVLIAGVVAVVALAIFLPMWNMVQLLS